MQDRELKKLVEACPNLTSFTLDCRSNRITDEGLQSLQSLTNLTELSLNECEQITDAELFHLRNMQKLTKLKLAYCRITNEGLRWLSSLPLEIIFVERFIDKKELRKDIPSLKNIEYVVKGL